jgi:surface protein
LFKLALISANNFLYGKENKRCLKRWIISVCIAIVAFLAFVIVSRADAQKTDTVTIDSVSVANKSPYVDEVAPASFEDDKLNLDLVMTNIGDSITYRLVVSNHNSHDYEMDSSNFLVEKDYVSYRLTIEDGGTVIKVNESKVILVTVEFTTEVPESMLENGYYRDTQSLSILLSALDGENPPTNSYDLTPCIVIVLCCGLCIFFVVKNSKTRKGIIVLIAVLSLVPLGVTASKGVAIDIDITIAVRSIAEFDIGRGVNDKMNALSGDKANIVSFKRSSVLSEDIKTVADQQLEDAKSVSVTTAEVEARLEDIKANKRTLQNFYVEGEGETASYCYLGYYQSNTCISYIEQRNTLASEYVVIAQGEEGTDDKYLILGNNSKDIEILTESELTRRLERDLLAQKRRDMSPNILSSQQSAFTIYGWYDEGAHAIEWYCEKENVFLNVDSSSFFYGLTMLAELPGFEANNMSHVVNMSSMLENAGSNNSALNFDLSEWDVSNVVLMRSIFQKMGRDNSSFHLDVSGWDVASVIDMSSMFAQIGYMATDWSIDGLPEWDVSNVQGMEYMFTQAACNINEFDWDLSSWDVSSAISMFGMFNFLARNASSFRLNVANWNAPNVKTVQMVLQGAGGNSRIFSLDASNWNLPSASIIGQAFAYAGSEASTSFNLNVSNWMIPNVESANAVFGSTAENAKTFNIDVSDWDVSNISDFSSFFANSGRKATSWSVGDLSKWDISGAKWLDYMFSNTASGNTASLWYAGDLSGWNTSNVIDMEGMFASAGAGASSWSVGDLSGWNTSKVQDMRSMFSHSGFRSSSWNIGDLSGWDTSNVTRMDSMFSSAGANSPSWSSIGTLKVYADSIPFMFYNCLWAKATINIYNNPSSYENAFLNTAVNPGAGVTVNYKSEVTNITNIINTKSNTSRVYQGSLIGD